MDKNLALGLAKQFVPDEKNPVSVNDKNLKISDPAKNTIDTNQDKLLSQNELKTAFLNDVVYLDEKSKTILKKDEKIEVANKISFFDIKTDPERKHESFQEESTYKGEQWYKDAFNPKVGNADTPYQGIDGKDVSTLSATDVNNLVGKSFNEAASKLKTPYDVANLLDPAITYQPELILI